MEPSTFRKLFVTNFSYPIKVSVILHITFKYNSNRNIIINSGIYIFIFFFPY